MSSFHINTLWDNNITSCENSSRDDSSAYRHFGAKNIYELQMTITCCGLVVTLAAIFAVFSLMKRDKAAPVYVLNLLISDVVQLCCMIRMIAAHKPGDMVFHIYVFGVMASVGFMVCVSVERYLVIAWPLWYKFKRNIKVPILVCVVVWVVVLALRLTVYLLSDFNAERIISAVFLLLPFPLFIFFLVGTFAALSAARSVPVDEKRRVVAIQVLVLFIYTLLFLPIIIFCLLEKARTDGVFTSVALICSNISPLTDSAMYIFLRKSAIDRVLASLCWKMSNSQLMSGVHNESMSVSFSEKV